MKKEEKKPFMWTLAQQTLSKLKRMTDSDYDSQNSISQTRTNK